MDPGPTSVPPRNIDIARLRSLSDSQSGPRPVAIEYAAVATDSRPGTLLVAGGGLRYDETAVLVWRLITPGGDTVINSGLTSEQAMASGFARYHPELQATVDSWLTAARKIAFTSEEIDHVGGLVAHLSENLDLVGKVSGNRDQLKAIRSLSPLTTKSLPAESAILVDQAGYFPIAPGIAAVCTPGHRKGSEMIYVRLQDGREYLFVGDTAPMRRNVEWQRPRSRYEAEWLGAEDRAATLAWIKGLSGLEAREPGLKIVYGHDLGWLTDPVAGPRFAPAAPSPVPVNEGQAAR